jgi:hypothetical protein
MIEFLGRQTGEIQHKVEQAITILRLFKVGSVDDLSYTMQSESILDMMGGAVSFKSAPKSILEKSLIEEDDVKRLKTFWQTMVKVLPQGFYALGETKADHLLIAYSRYCDSLLQNGLSERRIANAVMGLESLFLKGSETQELVYRLGIRIAKVLSFLGCDPYKVREVVEDGYKIRSLFVHGSNLSYSKKKMLSSKYNDVKSFMKLLLDYLRISIILMILLNKEKEEFLDIVDDSFVDMNKNDQLNRLLKSSRDYVFL